MHHLLSENVQSGDWKNEKHVPVIQAPANVKKDETFELVISIGEEIPHPNTFEHHIKWIKAFFKPEGAKFPIEIATVSFDAHGESDIYSDYFGTVKTKIQGSGTLYALSYCNIHGLWENSIPIVCE
ncbi:superoxide reductase [Alkalibaculum sp. M08DMB]|uniref:Superoxide reductase n=1 Tax=Alkalibaculum sporogenes TaxID=2655001 RepID=A0A6A7K6I1_9FIRM|nr:class II SORL domain-containing protein [Alkalibaculum sporogenes]MPW24984.1 superoxide reductase [Alkalibaculum sporogenes]